MTTELWVAKFGGSSLADADGVIRVAEIIRSQPERRVIVVSAPGKSSIYKEKVTNVLFCCADSMNVGDMPAASSAWQKVRVRFEEMIDRLCISPSKIGIWGDVDFTASSDFVVSRGEYFMAKILAEYIGAEFVEASEVFFFDEGGVLNIGRTYTNLRARCSDPGKRYVVPGFYGADINKRIRLFPRGGSDITGAHCAVALGAERYENWTDVDGVYTADPGMVVGAKPISVLSYSCLRELSLGGAGVYQHDAVVPLLSPGFGIPLVIRNTRKPSFPGTRVASHVKSISKFPVGIASRGGYSMLRLCKSGVGNQVGFGQGLLALFAKHNVPLDHAPTSTDSMAVVFQTKSCPQEVLDKIGQLAKEQFLPDELEMQTELSMVAVVGESMDTALVAGALFGKLCTLPGLKISFATWCDSRSVILGVPEFQESDVVQALHEEFFSKK